MSYIEHASVNEAFCKYSKAKQSQSDPRQVHCQELASIPNVRNGSKPDLRWNVCKGSKTDLRLNVGNGWKADVAVTHRFRVTKLR